MDGGPSQAFSLGLDAFILDRLLGDLAPTFRGRKCLKKKHGESSSFSRDLL